MNFFKHLFGSSASLDLVNIMQVELDLRNATGTKNLLKKFTQPYWARYKVGSFRKPLISAILLLNFSRLYVSDRSSHYCRASFPLPGVFSSGDDLRNGWNCLVIGRHKYFFPFFLRDLGIILPLCASDFDHRGL